LQELAEQRRRMADNDANASISDLERQSLGQQLINELKLKTGKAKAEGSIRHFLDLLEAGRPPLSTPFDHLRHFCERSTPDRSRMVTPYGSLKKTSALPQTFAACLITITADLSMRPMRNLKDYRKDWAIR